MIAELRHRLSVSAIEPGIELAVLPVFRSSTAPPASSGHSMSASARRMSRGPKNGPYTGEVTAAMLAELGCATPIGHADRRRLLGDSDEAVHERQRRPHAMG